MGAGAPHKRQRSALGQSDHAKYPGSGRIKDKAAARIWENTVTGKPGKEHSPPKNRRAVSACCVIDLNMEEIGISYTKIYLSTVTSFEKLLQTVEILITDGAAAGRMNFHSGPGFRGAVGMKMEDLLSLFRPFVHQFQPVRCLHGF